MLTPIIDKHVYDCSNTVRVYSVETGSKVIVRSANQKIGEAVAPGGSVIISLERMVQKDETLTAVAQMGSQTSNPSAPVTVQALPASIATPLIETTLYEGGTCISAWGVLPGSNVRAWNGANLIGEGVTHSGLVLIRLHQPLTGNDFVQMDATMCHHQSAKTPAVTPVRPQGSGPYAEKLPAPEVLRPLFACHRVANLKGLLPGAQFQVFARAKGQAAPGSIVFDLCAPEVSPAVLLGKTLQEEDEVKAWQRFDVLNLKSDYSWSVFVQKPDQLNAPKLDEPIFEGARSVSVFHLLNSVKVEIAVDGVSQGMADYDGESEFDLGFELTAGQVLKARQGLCNYWSPWSNEVKVRRVAERVPPPLLEKPLYACANLVRVADKLEGSLVEVYVDGIYAGEDKSRLISVIPHLQAAQSVTATQRLGKQTSRESLAVVVQEVKDQPTPPVLQIPTDPRFVEVSNLIPGARVNVLWHTLLIASKEAIDTVEEIPLEIEPWPGAQIHANQSICMKKSADSNTVIAVGKIIIETITGSSVMSDMALPTPVDDRALVHDKLTVMVRTQWPVKQDTKVKLSSSDPNVAKVLGAGEATIAAGGTKTTFPLQAVSPGVVYLELSAPHFKQAYDGYWTFRGDNRYELLVHGIIDISPDTKTIQEESSFNMTVSADPVPADRKVILEDWVAPSGMVTDKVITIPAGQTSTNVMHTAPKTGSKYAIQYDIIATRAIFFGSPPAGAPDDWLVSRDGYKIRRYREDECAITVEPKPVQPPPTPPPPPSKESTTTITLQEDICANYTKDGFNLVVPATLLKIKNLTQYNLKIFRYVGSAPPGEPPFSITLAPKEEKPASLQSKDIGNGWGATITDNIQCANAPQYVSFLITYKK